MENKKLFGSTTTTKKKKKKTFTIFLKIIDGSRSKYANKFNFVN
jgi:hypothetical protein